MKVGLLRSLCALLLGCLLNTALAHGDFPIHLAGQTLCLAPTSVIFDFEEMDAARQAAARNELVRELRADLTNVLATANVNLEEQTSCAADDAFVLLTVGVRYLDPRTYIGFGEDAYSYDLSLQVGALEDALAAGSESTPVTLQNLRFAASAGDIHSEGEIGAPFEEAVETQAAPLIGALAAAWWEDNSPGAWRKFLPPLLSVGLSVLIAAVIFAVARSRRRARSALFSRQR